MNGEPDAPFAAAPALRPSHDAWTFLRFLAAGLINTSFGYVVFAAIVWVGAGPLAALCLGTVAGAIFNFQTSRRIVFRSAGRVVRFGCVYGVVLILNWLALRGAQRLGIGNLAAQAMLCLPIAAASFAGQWIFVFGAAVP